MTPAVYAAARAAQVEPLPYLFICAFVANAASFVLPIANPANLVVFGGQMPALSEWLRYFAGPSFVAILATYVGLRLTQRPALERRSPLSGRASVDVRWQACGARNCADCRSAAVGICIRPATWVTDFLCRRILGRDRAGIGRQSPVPILKDVRGACCRWWLVFRPRRGANQTGVLSALAHNLHDAAGTSPQATCGSQASSSLLPPTSSTICRRVWSRGHNICAGAPQVLARC